MKKQSMFQLAAFFAAAIFVISIPMSFAATPQSVHAQTIKSIEAYGNDSQTFAATISSNATWMKTDPTNLIVIISAVGNNLTDLNLEIQKASCIVFINLPANNGLYDAPKVTVESAGSAQTTYPTYWIAIIKKGNAGLISNLLTSNDTLQVRQEIWAEAISTVTTNTVTTGTQTQVSPMQSYQQATWLQMYPLLTTKYWIDSNDWLYSWHLISEANAYDSVDAWEWWEVTSYTDHYLGSFVTNPFQDGPFVAYTYTSVMAASSAQEQTYGPTSTASDTTISYNIGVDFSQNGVGFAAGASYSETNPGVGVSCKGNSQNVQNWTDSYNGPNYYDGMTWPLYSPAPNQDHNQWNTQMTVIYHTPLYSGFKAGRASDKWTIYNDVPPESLAMYLAGGWRATYTYTLSYSWNNMPSYFGKYAATVVTGSTFGIGNGHVYNPSNLLGNYMDANYAQIYGGNSGDGGQITLQLNSAANGGHVYVYGYSQNGYYSHMTVLVSSNGNTWTQISDQMVYYTTGLGWIDCGSYSGSFSYVQIKGLDTSPYYDSVNLFLDCLLVAPS
jgi:hypothetical protein